MQMHPRPRVIVGMSGGVDSSVAALLLLEQGWAVEGLFMDNWEDDDEPGYCRAADDFQDARQVCERLDIPLHRVSFAAEYRECVFQQFLGDYAAGRTPNPDVLCNREIKFKAFLDYALRLGAGRIATGHYARVASADGTTRLLRAADTGKDQTYFLHAVPQAALVRSVFPLGDMLKREVRARARAAGFENHAKPDSTGICFIGERPFGKFLARYLHGAPGNIETPEGETVGRHSGLMFYTLGQRQGLGIGGCAGATGRPWYVAGKDAYRNVLIVVQGHEHPRLFHRALTASELHWIASAPPASKFRCTAKSRYRQADQVCTVTLGAAGDCRVEFAQPQRALTPGQYAVFYRGDACLGGGVIATVDPAQTCARLRGAA
ncbi:MAG: tRNA 2-thiouridine(34) synthase MnmA [Gammaproteobacteria bacterium]